MKVVIITQARLSSTRFPSKVLKPVDAEDSLLSLHLKRLKGAKEAHAVVLATTKEAGVEALIKVGTVLDVPFYQGSTEDVLDRYYKAALDFNADVVVRVTSDCPLIDPKLIDQVVQHFKQSNVDYVSTGLSEHFPDGVDCEVFLFSALERAWKEARSTYEREHVTPFIWRNSSVKKGTIFKSSLFENAFGNQSSYRLTVDTPEDLKVVQLLVEKTGKAAGWQDYVQLLEKHPEIKEINMSNTKNEGYFKSRAIDAGLRFITRFEKSNLYRRKSHDLIPGGAHTYSKGDDQFPVLSPAAISHGKGAHVWDLDGNEFLDCSMGLTSVSLGHAYEPVIKRITEELGKGVNFQRPSYIELEIAEKFLGLIPSHQMIKFSKNGSTATTAAVKIARAYTGRKMVAFPFDHPFYSYDDWFIGQTPANKGVPEEFKSLSVTFKSESMESLKEIFAKYPGQIACVISEPEKPHGPNQAFLDQAIEFVQSQGALFIMDEMITGFKTSFPGNISHCKNKPDMATWGKGIANGFSFCALTGKKEVMELGGIRDIGKDKLFLISTTHGGETSAIAAALATIHEFQNKDVIGHNHRIGALMREKISKVLRDQGLERHIEYQAADWMQTFVFKDKNGVVSQGMRTLMMQEMIRRGVLFQGAFVPCFSHTEEDVEYFCKAFSLSLEVYALALESGYETYLVGEPAKPVFRAKI